MAAGRAIRYRANVLRPIALPLALALASCGDPGAATGAPAPVCAQGDELEERHGTDCLCCHAEDFTVAGSIAPGAAIQAIVVRDAAGQALAMTPNAYANFFLHEPLSPPLEAWILGEDGAERRMRGAAPHGSCNRCHREGAEPGLLDIP